MSVQASSAGVSVVDECPKVRRIGLVGGLHVGVETVFKNARQAAAGDGAIHPVAIPIASYQLDRFERLLPFLPKSTRGTLRYITGTAPLFTTNLDVVWTLLDLPMLPWMLTKNRNGLTAVVFSADATPRQLRAFGEHYGYWGGRSDWKFGLREALYRIFIRRTAAIQLYTEWAARSIRDDYGIPAEKVRVFPPGVDIDFWRPAQEPSLRALPHVIFVGGDFHRKGGDLLLDVFRRHFRGRIELDLVTRAGAATPEPGVHVHTDIKPNDLRLVGLYRQASILALPTRADCFSIASLEAMACGLPVITCPVGGVGEIFASGAQGVFVPPDDGRALTQAIEVLLANHDLRQSMGEAGRKLVLERYDARINTSRLLNLVDEVNGKS
jgi:glycosyltransferase involved in cell wall biosynthesis